MENNTSGKADPKQTIIDEIYAHEKFDSFFKGFKPSSVRSFLNMYAIKKLTWLAYGPTYKTELEHLEIQWENEAMERLKEIQHVKLFLFQCRYRAGVTENHVKGVRTVFDFAYWRDNVLNARFLEPVTENDIKLYSKYLMSSDVDHNVRDIIDDWQDYEEIRKAYAGEEADCNVPEWYEYYFNHTGTGVLLSLPDIKGEKDSFYFKLGHEEKSRLFFEEQKKLNAGNPSAQPEKGTYFNENIDDNMARFINLFESKETRQLYEAYNAYNNFNEREDDLQEDFNTLLYAKKDVPIQSNKSWMEGLHLAASCYRSMMIIESFPAAYSQYIMNLDLDINFSEKETGKKESEYYNDMVLLGRKANGEPENFDY